jgi:phosphoglycolate phosphatase
LLRNFVRAFAVALWLSLSWRDFKFVLHLFNGNRRIGLRENCENYHKYVFCDNKARRNRVIKYVIFDFDGTLVDSQDVAISVLHQLAESHHFKKPDRKDIEAMRGLSIAERCKIIGVPMYKLPFWAGECYRLYQQSLKHLHLFDGIAEVLNALRERGFKLAVISSNSEANVREFLKENQIDIFDRVYCSRHIFSKDRVIKKFLHSLKLTHSEVIYVGDEHRDIVACKRLGVKVIWVEWGFDLIELVKPENPDYIVRAPAEILDIYNL